MPEPVSVTASADGTLVYRIAHPPSELPAVRGRDILAAWDRATLAAQGALHGARRAFHFSAPDGLGLRLAITDRDIRCWAGAADAVIAMHTAYGLSVFLRLLALLDVLRQLAGERAVRDLRNTAEHHPLLLRLAAETRLTDDAGLDPSRFLPLLGSGVPATLPTGAPLT